MRHWFQWALAPFTVKQLPPEAYQLATAYQLGIPTKRYSNVIASLLILVIVLMAELSGVIFFSYKQDKNYVPELVLAFILLSFGIVLIALEIIQLLRGSRIYECTEGFIEIEGKNVVLALRWDQIVDLQYTTTTSIGLRAVSIRYTCYVFGVDGAKLEIIYPGLRKRIEQELCTSRI